VEQRRRRCRQRQREHMSTIRLMMSSRLGRRPMMNELDGVDFDMLPFRGVHSRSQNLCKSSAVIVGRAPRAAKARILDGGDLVPHTQELGMSRAHGRGYVVGSRVWAG
jgi:hypothetical protein